MKTEKEILDALQQCATGTCVATCPYFHEEPQDCRRELNSDAINLVLKLQDENRAMRTELEVNFNSEMEDAEIPDQTAKQDNGKPRPTLTPPDVVYAVAGIEKYDQEAESLMKPKFICKTRYIKSYWKGLFECPYCGENFEAVVSNVMSGKQRSCGCAKGRLAVQSRGTHGESKTRLYRTYKHILERCNNPNCKTYPLYGGRGIKCEFTKYEEFRDYALSHGYTDQLTCERVDVNGNYAPGNVIFIPLQLQSRNTRSNVKITYKGLTLCASEWAGMMGVKPNTITRRKRAGWDDERIIETPVKGSVDMSLIPVDAINAIRTIRLFGTKKYGDPDNWKRVEKERYRDAAYRHFLSYLDDPESLDEESGYPHLWHMLTNLAFLCELEQYNVKIE